jgi:hypothetical protein
MESVAHALDSWKATLGLPPTESLQNTCVSHGTTKALWKAVTADTCTHGSRLPCGVEDGLVIWFCDHLPSSPSKSLRSEDPETTGNVGQKSSEPRIC